MGLTDLFVRTSPDVRWSQRLELADQKEIFLNTLKDLEVRSVCRYEDAKY